MRVLLADDDAVFREQLAEHLRGEGIDVVATVADGHGAVAEAMASAPDVVLIDYAMPGPDGGHAAAVIRQALPAVRILILSGRDRSELENVPPDVEVLRKGPTLESALAHVLRP